MRPGRIRGELRSDPKSEPCGPEHLGQAHTSSLRRNVGDAASTVTLERCHAHPVTLRPRTLAQQRTERNAHKHAHSTTPTPSTTPTQWRRPTRNEPRVAFSVNSTRKHRSQKKLQLRLKRLCLLLLQKKALQPLQGPLEQFPPTRVATTCEIQRRVLLRHEPSLLLRALRTLDYRSADLLGLADSCSGSFSTGIMECFLSGDNTPQIRRLR